MIFKQTLLKTLMVIFIVTCTTSTYAQQFSIQGNLEKSIQGVIVLSYYSGLTQKTTTDTSKVTNGDFQFKGRVDEPIYAVLILNPPVYDPRNPAIPTLDQRELYIDPLPARIIVKSEAGMSKAVITGGPSNQDFFRFMDMMKPLGDRGLELNDAYIKHKTEGNEKEVEEIQAEVESLRTRRREIEKNFIKDNPDSYPAFSIWLRKIYGPIQLPVIEQEFNRFSERIRNSQSGQMLATRINKAKILNVGKAPIDFTLPDTFGKPVTLSSFKGKNVLLCFWHRNFVPFETFAFDLVQMKEDLKGSNCEVISVFYNGDGQTKEFWMKTLEESGMTGLVNLFDENGISRETGALSTVAKNYDLDLATIPQCYLINSDGIILSRDIDMSKNPAEKVKALLLK